MTSQESLYLVLLQNLSDILVDTIAQLHCQLRRCLWWCQLHTYTFYLITFPFKFGDIWQLIRKEDAHTSQVNNGQENNSRKREMSWVLGLRHSVLLIRPREELSKLCQRPITIHELIYIFSSPLSIKTLTHIFLHLDLHSPSHLLTFHLISHL